MSRLRLLLPAIIVVSSAPVAAAAIPPVSAPHMAIAVTPPSGSSSTRFAVSFRNPVASGRQSGLLVREVISVTGPRPSKGSSCRSTADVTLPAAGAHATVRGAVTPGAGGWCVGGFAGTVTEERSIVCGGPPTGELCPQIEFPPYVLGRFRFTVSRAPA